eukprot:4838744-Pyramimonas_sp.AAC.1
MNRNCCWALLSIVPILSLPMSIVPIPQEQITASIVVAPAVLNAPEQTKPTPRQTRGIMPCVRGGICTGGPGALTQDERPH